MWRGGEKGDDHQHQDGDPGGDHGVGDLEVQKERIVGDRLGGKLYMGYGRAQESTAELVPQSPTRETDDEDDAPNDQHRQHLGASEDPGHYPFSLSLESELTAKRAVNI